MKLLKNKQSNGDIPNSYQPNSYHYSTTTDYYLPASSSRWNYDNIYRGGGYKPILPEPDYKQLAIDQLEKELAEAKERIRELEREVEEKVIVI